MNRASRARARIISAARHDEAVAAKLWEASERLTGVSFSFGGAAARRAAA